MRFSELNCVSQASSADRAVQLELQLGQMLKEQNDEEDDAKRAQELNELCNQENKNLRLERSELQAQAPHTLCSFKHRHPTLSVASSTALSWQLV